MEIINLPEEDIKVMVIKIINKLWRRMELSESFNKGYKKEVKIMRTGMKNIRGSQEQTR